MEPGQINGSSQIPRLRNPDIKSISNFNKSISNINSPTTNYRCISSWWILSPSSSPPLLGYLFLYVDLALQAGSTECPVYQHQVRGSKPKIQPVVLQNFGHSLLSLYFHFFNLSFSENKPKKEFNKLQQIRQHTKTWCKLYLLFYTSNGRMDLNVFFISNLKFQLLFWIH